MAGIAKYCCDNYFFFLNLLIEENFIKLSHFSATTIQGRKLFAEIRHSKDKKDSYFMNKILTKTGTVIQEDQKTERSTNSSWK